MEEKNSLLIPLQCCYLNYLKISLTYCLQAFLEKSYTPIFIVGICKRIPGLETENTLILSESSLSLFYSRLQRNTEQLYLVIGETMKKPEMEIERGVSP